MVSNLDLLTERLLGLLIGDEAATRVSKRDIAWIQRLCYFQDLAIELGMDWGMVP